MNEIPERADSINADSFDAGTLESQVFELRASEILTLPHLLLLNCSHSHIHIYCDIRRSGFWHLICQYRLKILQTLI